MPTGLLCQCAAKSCCAVLSCVLHRGNPHLQPILGVAWDCGAVTTGPVTVPILIALGVSVMKAQRQKQQAFAAIEDAAVNRSEGNTLEGFGIGEQTPVMRSHLPAAALLACLLAWTCFLIDLPAQLQGGCKCSPT